eukprot:Blabericola_migrator_1__29@NODE_1008_length_5718_cov_50_473191_g567_i2_p4_GENE_NODE_1008_length_5718_cov_50_473191_g567_i2NODE_1008_length_5718_cov_50_473191_g567_i2_p4_ORF_typecomplete_len132_score23_30_NODE_1008_length_5718_cov_50_473191_g567_i2518913
MVVVVVAVHMVVVVVGSVVAVHMVVVVVAALEVAHMAEVVLVAGLVVHMEEEVVVVQAVHPAAVDHVGSVVAAKEESKELDVLFHLTCLHFVSMKYICLAIIYTLAAPAYTLSINIRWTRERPFLETHSTP